MLFAHCNLQVSLHHRSFCLAVSRPSFYHEQHFIHMYGMLVCAVLLFCYSFSHRLAAILPMFSPSWSAIVFRICYAESWQSKNVGGRLEGSRFIHVLAKFGAIMCGSRSDGQTSQPMAPHLRYHCQGPILSNLPVIEGGGTWGLYSVSQFLRLKSSQYTILYLMSSLSSRCVSNDSCNSSSISAKSLGPIFRP